LSNNSYPFFEEVAKVFDATPYKQRIFSGARFIFECSLTPEILRAGLLPGSVDIVQELIPKRVQVFACAFFKPVIRIASFTQQQIELLNHQRKVLLLNPCQKSCGDTIALAIMIFTAKNFGFA